MGRRIALAIAIAVLLALPAQAGAAPAWLPTIDAAGPGPAAVGAQPPVAGFDAAGDLTIAYTTYDPAKAPTNLPYAVVATTRPAGGAFGAPTAVYHSNNKTWPSLAVAADGDAVLAINDAGTPPVAAFRPAGGAWGPTVPINGGQPALSNVVAGIDRDGNAIAAWMEVAPSGYVARVLSARRPRADGEWLTPTVTSADGSVANDGYLSLSVAPSGEALLAWLQGDGYGQPDSHGEYTVQAAFRTPGAARFGTPAPLGTSIEQPVYASLAPDGFAATAWTDASKVQIAERPTGGAFGAPAGVAAGSPYGIVATADDAVAVAWDGGAGNRLLGAVWRPGTAFPSPTPITADDVDRVALAGGGDGTVVTSWEGHYIPSGGGIGHRLGMAARAPGGGFGASTLAFDKRTSSEFAVAPGAAADGAGDAVATWLHQTPDGNEILEATPYDGAGPRLSDVSGFGATTAGATQAFGFAAVDVWSPIAATTWAFGDGATSAAAQTGHAYAGAGAFTATATAIDAVGNASSASGLVTVAPGQANVGSGGTGGTGGPASTPPANATADKTPPTVKRFRLSHARFRVARAATALTARARIFRGTAFRYTLSEAAKVRIVIATACTKATKKRARRCKAKRAGTLTRKSQRPGARTLPFTGRLGRRALKLGRYTATVTASDAAGNASKPARLTFTIVR